MSIKDEIAKQEEIIVKLKAKYDADVKKLKDLYTKQDSIKKKELFTTFEKSGKSYDETMLGKKSKEWSYRLSLRPQVNR